MLYREERVSGDEIIERADLEEQTVDEVLAILSAEFEEEVEEREEKEEDETQE